MKITSIEYKIEMIKFGDCLNIRSGFTEYKTKIDKVW